MGQEKTQFPFQKNHNTNGFRENPQNRWDAMKKKWGIRLEKMCFKTGEISFLKSKITRQDDKRIWFELNNMQKIFLKLLEIADGDDALALRAQTYLIDRLLGKPKESVEISTPEPPPDIKFIFEEKPNDANQGN